MRYASQAATPPALTKPSPTSRGVVAAMFRSYASTRYWFPALLRGNPLAPALTPPLPSSGASRPCLRSHGRPLGGRKDNVTRKGQKDDESADYSEFWQGMSGIFRTTTGPNSPDGSGSGSPFSNLVIFVLVLRFSGGSFWSPISRFAHVLTTSISR